MGDRMNPLRRLCSDLQNFLARRGRHDIRTYLRVFNLTRQTVLAQSVELADTSAKRRKGLLGRERLGPGEGLWIIPCESVHTIGMKFPIDIVYLDRKHRIKKIGYAVPAWRLSACLTAHSVLELASGTIRETETEPGDRLEFSPVCALAASGSTTSGNIQ